MAANECAAERWKKEERAGRRGPAMHARVRVCARAPPHAQRLCLARRPASLPSWPPRPSHPSFTP
eukprot:scaffold17997_cov101-Isochrysis_galbana.AAC.1